MGGIDPRQWFGPQDGHEHPETQQNDPEKYARSAEITETSHLMAIQALDANHKALEELLRRYRDLTEEINIARAERTIMDTKFWREMREQFPQVLDEKQCGAGYRTFEERVYLVSWGGDEINEGDQPQPREEQD